MVRRFGKSIPDLYEIAEQLRREQPRRYRQVYFEDRSQPTEYGGSLWFDTYPANVIVMPRKRQGALVYDVEFSWRYRTQWEEYESIEVEMGTYKTPRRAVEKAMELALWSEQDIKEAFRDEGYV